MLVSQNELQEFVTDLEILSGLRKLQSETKKQVQKMPIIYDLTKDIRFKEGVEVGMEKGEDKKARIGTIQLLKNGLLSVVMIAEALEVPLDFVLKIQEELERNPNLK